MIGAIGNGADAIRGAALLGRTCLPGDSKGNLEYNRMANGGRKESALKFANGGKW